MFIPRMASRRATGATDPRFIVVPKVAVTPVAAKYGTPTASIASATPAPNRTLASAPPTPDMVMMPALTIRASDNRTMAPVAPAPKSHALLYAGAILGAVILGGAYLVLREEHAR